MAQLTSLTALDMAVRIRRKEISPVELVEAHLDRILALQPKLNAFVHIDARGARARARDAEAAVMRGDQLGSLHGIPLTIKSCIDVAGWKCEAGSALRKDYVALRDAALVARLKSAGAILLGNTNVPEFLMAYETNNSLFGRTCNPWNLGYTAGGSSGGEAAAIASGCSAGGVGSDGGGSIRVPAHFCGICGLKPTPGRIAITGHFPPGGGCFSWIGVVGPMARTVADVRALFEVMAGPDPGDPCSAPVPVRPVSEAEIRGTRIGILESSALGVAAPETRAAVERAAKLLADLGFVVEPFQIGALDRALELWWIFFGPTISHLFRAGLGQDPSLLSPMLREYLRVTAAEPPLTLDQLLTACTDRDLALADILRQMEEVPILLSPVSSAPAFRHGEGAFEGEHDYRKTMRHCQWLNLTGFPSAVVPVGMSPEGLPIGVQIIGRPYEEELVLEIAARLERARGTFPSPPLLT